ncbi:MAG: hypothetical protein LBC71_08000 [Oscillospiraceae bacterium]|jgi:hypothetical protein|nr:hypothetical protein [Oscillospiraceae bacterium]
MPLTAEHQKQYKHNIKLLSHDVFEANDVYWDWYVTILFYSALHLAEKEISKSAIEVKTHNERLKYIARLDPLNKISYEYYHLYNQSRRARYECVVFTKKELDELKVNFSKIEKLLA